VWLFVGPSFSQLLYDPKRIGISRHIEVQDLTPVVAGDEKAVQNTKGERWDNEEVHRRNGLAMVSDERQPSFHGIWISWGSPDPSRDTPFRDIETQLEHFAVNARCSPRRILRNHTEDQSANLFVDTLPSSYLSDSGDPCPIGTKPRPMPVHDSSRSDQHERLPPPGPKRSQDNPEQLLQGRQSMMRLLRLQSQQLLMESQIFKDEVLAGAESADHPAEEMPERRDHSRNHISEKSESSFAPSHSLCRCTGFWRGTGLLVIAGNLLLNWLQHRDEKTLDDARKKLLEKMLNATDWRKLSTLFRVIGADRDTTTRLLIELGARGSETLRPDGEEVWGLISKHPLEQIE